MAYINGRKSQNATEMRFSIPLNVEHCKLAIILLSHIFFDGAFSCHIRCLCCSRSHCKALYIEHAKLGRLKYLKLGVTISLKGSHVFCKENETVVFSIAAFKRSNVEKGDGRSKNAGKRSMPFDGNVDISSSLFPSSIFQSLDRQVGNNLYRTICYQKLCPPQLEGVKHQYIKYGPVPTPQS